MTSLTWEQRKQIGEALGYIPFDGFSGWHLFRGEGRTQLYGAGTEQEAWDAYQPDVLGEVIPWLEKNHNCQGFIFEFDKTWGGSLWPTWRAEIIDGKPTFPEAVCALMLAILEAKSEH